MADDVAAEGFAWQVAVWGKMADIYTRGDWLALRPRGLDGYREPVP